MAKGYDRRDFMMAAAAMLAAVGLPMQTDVVGAVHAAEPLPRGDGKVVKLPRPGGMGDRTLRACLDGRRSDRTVNKEDLDLQTMSDLFWAAWGVNREDGRRTVPTGRNKQPHRLFAARGDGVWLYRAKSGGEEQEMERVLMGDLRDRFDGSGCVFLIAGDTEDAYAPLSAGAIYQSLGLACAALGLANCVKATNRNALDADLPLPKGWAVMITHSVNKA